MANEEHLEILNQGVKVWNQWRKENPEIRPDLSAADLSGVTLRAANLSHAYISGTLLIEADLTGAVLWCADLSVSILRRTNLTRAYLREANLNGAILSETNLTGANLLASQAVGTSFQGATLTGACIGDWNISSRTDLQNVICDYIFTDWKDVSQFVERRPHDPKRNFAPGEFTKRYQRVVETVELFFNDGVDWRALLTSLQDLQNQYRYELTIEEMRQGAGRSIIVAVGIPPEADKGMVERLALQGYDIQRLIAAKQRIAELEGLETTLKREIQHKDDILASELRHNAVVGEIAKSLAERSITFAVSNAQIQQSATIEQPKDAKTEEKPPEDRSKRKRLIALLTAAGLAISGVVTWATDLGGKLKEFSEQWGITIPGLAESAEPDQSPSSSPSSPQP